MMQKIFSDIKKSLKDKNGKKYQIIARSLEGVIRAGEIKQGQKLPTIRDMANAIQINIGTVNRAYLELDKHGLTESRVGDGTYVNFQEQKYFQNEIIKDNGFYISHFQSDLSRYQFIPHPSKDYLFSSLEHLIDNREMLKLITQYTPERGLRHHREAGARLLKFCNVDLSEDKIICTIGAQQALSCVLQSITHYGDCVASDIYTYPGLIAYCRIHGVRIAPVQMDEKGMIPESLKEVVKKNKITALYCNPSRHNPTNACMDTERRQRIAEICEENRILIIEDETHHLIYDNPYPSLQSLAPDITFFIFGLSKIISSGLRIGYMSAPKLLLNKITASLRSTTWMSPPLNMEIATKWINDGSIHEMNQFQLEEIARRKGLIGPYLENLKYHTSFDSPLYWIEVEEPFRSSEVEKILLDNDVIVSSSEKFQIGRTSEKQYIRACITGPVSDKALVHGFKVILEILTNSK